MISEFRVGDVIVHKEKDMPGNSIWIREAKVIQIRDNELHVECTEPIKSHSQWLGDKHIITTERLKKWELKTEYKAKKQFDKELEELLK